jgi:hypothetical protein
MGLSTLIAALVVFVIGFFGLAVPSVVRLYAELHAGYTTLFRACQQFEQLRRCLPAEFLKGATDMVRRPKRSGTGNTRARRAGT